VTKAIAIPKRELPAQRGFDPFAELVDKFFTRKSPETLRQYRSALRRFAEWFGHESPVVALGMLCKMSKGEAHLVVQRWVDAMDAAELAPATIQQRLSILRNFIELASATERCAWTLSRTVRGPRVEADDDVLPLGSAEQGRAEWLKLRAYLEGRVADAAVRLRNGTIRHRVAVLLLRDLALLRVMYACAMRRVDASRVDVVNVDVENHVIATRGKGKRRVKGKPLPKPTAEVVAHWMRVRAAWLKECGRSSPALFISEKSERIGERAISHMIERRCKEAGVDLKPHDFRRLCITRGLEKADGNYGAAMKISGHVKPETLFRYDMRRRQQPHELAERIDEDD
jgi:integrase